MTAAGALTAAKSNGEATKIRKVEDFGELSAILSKSSTQDAYCRSTIYFALTGRRKVWILEFGDRYLILVLHPNSTGTLLVFFPFISSAADFFKQVEVLRLNSNFQERFSNHVILLARVPDFIVGASFQNHRLSLESCTLRLVDETRLDWAYPSYDLDLQKLISPQGGKLKAYRRKLHLFHKDEVEIIRPRQLSSPKELWDIVAEINRGWVRTKLASPNSIQLQGVSRRDLFACYRAMAKLYHDPSLKMDGLILKRGKTYLAFSFWECPTDNETVPCLAALTVSHEKGLSEYLYHCIAACLDKTLFQKMCVGGSETDSLDRFKRKLDPIKAIKLFTLELLPLSSNGMTPLARARGSTSRRRVRGAARPLAADPASTAIG